MRPRALSLDLHASPEDGNTEGEMWGASQICVPRQLAKYNPYPRVGSDLAPHFLVCTHLT